MSIACSWMGSVKMFQFQRNVMAYWDNCSKINPSGLLSFKPSPILLLPRPVKVTQQSSIPYPSSSILLNIWEKDASSTLCVSIFNTSVCVTLSCHMHHRNNSSCVLPILMSCGLLIISEPYIKPFVLRITGSQERVGYGQQARNQCWTSPDLSLWWYPPKSNLCFYISYQRAFLMCSRSFLFFWLPD